MHGITRQHGTIYFTGIMISILLSCWAGIREVVINPDAICYLQSAQSMSMGISYAAHLCDQAHWPFYSAFIYLVATFTKISYTTSAYLLDGLFSLISVVSFVGIIQCLKGNTRTLWLAAAVILLAHEFNAVREYIVRDHGFWAFYLSSLLLLLNFFRTRLWVYAIAWSVSLIIATLFRIEGIIFLLALPFATVFLSSQRLQAFCKLNAVTFVGIILLAAMLPHQNADHLGRLGELKFQLLHGVNTITQNFHARADILSQQLLNQYSAHDASLILLLVLAAWYLTNIIGNLSLIYAVLVVYAWCKKSMPLEKSSRIVLWSYIAVNVLITAAFLAENMFLSKRYLLALSLTLMVWVPFALNYLCQQSRKWPFMLAVFFMVIYSLGGIFDFGYSKKYIHDAGQWLSANTTKTNSIYSNDYQVMYYSQHFGNEIFAKASELSKSTLNDKWHQYDFLALRLNKNDVAINGVKLSEFGSPIIVFSNKRGDKVNIYKVH